MSNGTSTDTPTERSASGASTRTSSSGPSERPKERESTAPRGSPRGSKPSEESTRSGRRFAFTRMLERAGVVVEPPSEPVTAEERAEAFVVAAIERGGANDGGL